MKKIVNGQDVDMTAEEAAAWQAESDANALLIPAQQAIQTNRNTIQSSIGAEVDAIRQFRDSGTTWSGLTNNQKDALIARLAKDVEWLGRLVAQKFDKAD